MIFLNLISLLFEASNQQRSYLRVWSPHRPYRPLTLVPLLLPTGLCGMNVVWEEYTLHTHLENPWTGNILPRRSPSHMGSQRSTSSVRGHGCTGSVWPHSGTLRWPPPPCVPPGGEPGPLSSQWAHTPGPPHRRAAASVGLCSLELRGPGASAL